MKLFVLLLLVAFSRAFPAPPQANLRQSRSSDLLRNFEKWDSATTAEYLLKYGYISQRRMTQAGGLVDVNSFSKSIKEFQRMAGLKPTGKMDADTARIMSMPRCGVEDTVGAFMMGSEANIADSKFRNKNERRKAKRMKKKKHNNKKEGKSRTKRYNLEGGRWTKRDLKYHILNFTPDMSRGLVKDSIKRALEVWSNYTTLTFTHTDIDEEADIKISFGERSHGDPYAFDGAGGTLAHAFFPSDGRAHFDDAEKFTFRGKKGINLFIVAAHEFGHSLGLAHSSVPNSLMAPFYQGYVPNFTLHSDDIAAIQQLYGRKAPDPDERKKPPTPSPTAKPTKPTKPRKPHPDAMLICGDEISFDSMHFNHKEGVLYVFKGTYFWKITDEGAMDGYPRKIHRYWRGLPGNINATVYSKTTGRTYFFKGSRVWRYNQNRTLERGFPQRSSALGLPSNLQAAMQWGRDGLIYVFKNGNFYQFSEYQSYDGRNQYGKKKVHKYWEGVPAQVDDAIQWKNGKTYFFKGDKYWRFSGLGKSMDVHYPRSFKKYWVGCTDKTNPHARYAKAEKSKNKKKNKKKGGKSKNPKDKKNKKDDKNKVLLSRLVEAPKNNQINP